MLCRHLDRLWIVAVTTIIYCRSISVYTDQWNKYVKIWRNQFCKKHESKHLQRVNHLDDVPSCIQFDEVLKWDRMRTAYDHVRWNSTRGGGSLDRDLRTTLWNCAWRRFLGQYIRTILGKFSRVSRPTREWLFRNLLETLKVNNNKKVTDAILILKLTARPCTLSKTMTFSHRFWQLL